MKGRRAIAFVPYALGTAPSQRFRLEQWQARLRDQGIAVDFRPFASPSLVSLLYNPGQTLRKAVGLARAFVEQYRSVRTAGSFDMAIVHRGISLVGPALLERRLASIAPIIYDFDDAIHVLSTSPVNQSFGWMKFPAKTAEICRLARGVTVGNQYLADFAGQHNQNVTVVPSSVDTALYRPGGTRAPRAKPIVGWMGSSTSQYLLEQFASMLSKIPEAGLTLRLVSDRRPTSFPFFHEWRPWSVNTEVEELQDFDLGIMPLPDTEWVKGKCAMKILQYMGVGIPSVGSALGGNIEVIRDGENGLLVGPDDDWMEKITRVARDPTLARRLGAAGRETVIERYSSDVCADRFAKALHQVVDD